MADVHDSRDDEGLSGRSSSADATDLLDLVRGAEEDARVSASSPELETELADPRPSEQFVDVGDEAIDLPPSLPPMRAASTRPPRSRGSSVPPPPARPPPRIVHENDLRPPMNPALAVVLVFAAAIAALYGLLALPPL